VNHNDLCLKAIHLIQEDKWHEAHAIVEKMDSPLAARIHGLLHSIEGDQWNADYWYRQAGKPPLRKSVDQECAAIIAELTSA